MSDIRARELRNDLGRLLRRVQAGEHLRVTLRGRPVAEVVPISSRARTMPWPAFRDAILRSPADGDLRRDLAEALPDDTDRISVG